MKRETIKRLVHFFVLGGMLAGADALLAEDAPSADPVEMPVLQVTLPPGADATVRQSMIDEALLVREAVRLGWPTHDRVVRDRLVRNIAFAQPDLPEDRRLATALELGMAQTDPVARARLADRARRELTQEVALETPDEGALRRILEAHADRYRAPASLRFSQVFLDPGERGEQLEADAAALLDRLRRERPAPPTALGLGDGLLIAKPEETRPAEALDRSYGKDFGQALLDLPRGEWSGPVASTYGHHLVFVHEVTSARMRTLDEVRAAVTAQWRRDRSDEVLRNKLQELEAAVTVRVVEASGAQ